MKSRTYSSIKNDFLYAFYEFNRVQAKHPSDFSVESAYAYAFEEVLSGIESAEEMFMLNLIASVLLYNISREAFTYHLQQLKKLERLIDLDEINTLLKEDAYYLKADLKLINELTV